MQTFINGTQSAEKVLFLSGEKLGLFASPKGACENRSFKAGEGATIHLYTDAHACTVISATRNRIIVQRDKATRITQPKFVAGGSAANCTNNDEIKYTYARNTRGSKHTFTRRKSGKWVEQGSRMQDGRQVSNGRFEHYDYNF